MDLYNVNVIVRHDGTCSWFPPAKLKTSCDIDMHYFPFDTQTCYIKVGSWESLIYFYAFDIFTVSTLLYEGFTINH